MSRYHHDNKEAWDDHEDPIDAVKVRLKALQSELKKPDLTVKERKATQNSLKHWQKLHQQLLDEEE